MKRFALQRRTLAVLAVLVPLAALLGYVALRSGPLAPVAVTEALAERRALQPAVFGIGTVEARHTLRIGPTVAGRVQQVNVDVGDSVRAGQLLAAMDPVDLQERIRAQAAAMQRSIDCTARSEEYLLSCQITAGYSQLTDLPKIIEPVAQKHHRRTGGTAFPRNAFCIIAVQTVQHDIPDDFRRNLLPLKKEAHRIQHGRRTAIIFRHLITQGSFHHTTFFPKIDKYFTGILSMFWEFVNGVTAFPQIPSPSSPVKRRFSVRSICTTLPALMMMTSCPYARLRKD